MCKLTISLTKQNEQRLRERNRKKGDLSNIINAALDAYFVASVQKDADKQ